MKKIGFAGLVVVSWELFFGRAHAQPYVPITNQVSGTQVAGFVILPTPGNLWSISITTGASAGYLMVFDSYLVPNSGTVSPKNCWYVPATSSDCYVNVNGSLSRYNSGISAAFSSTGCYTYTPSNTAFISAQAQ